jgi:hypothetical protein
VLTEYYFCRNIYAATSLSLRKTALSLASSKTTDMQELSIPTKNCLSDIINHYLYKKQKPDELFNSIGQDVFQKVENIALSIDWYK